MNTHSGERLKVFTFEQNRCSRSFRMTVHVRPEWVFTLPQNMQTVNEIGQEFGVHPTQVGMWKKELQEQASSLFDAKRGPKPADPSASPERLYSEIGRLKMELDWLKKKSGISQ